MARRISWFAEGNVQGWSCSHCSWRYAAPSLLTGPEAKQAFDRLANAKYVDHKCEQFPHLSTPPNEKSIADRIHTLLTRGYRPKDAVELVLQEVMLEHRHEPNVVERAQAEAEDFLQRLREGRI